MNLTKIEITNGKRCARFVRDERGWKPDWFYEGDRPMLRFKDHEWLSVGHIHPDRATRVEQVRGGGVIFSDIAKYGSTNVEWSIKVQPDKAGDGFSVECIMKPEATIELLEAYTTFETPYEYDGTETVTTVIGQNPVERWKGNERLTPPQWRHAVWAYSRPDAVRMTGPCNIPLLCQAIETDSPAGSRYTSIIGDWTVCKVRDVYVTPTRTIETYRDDWAENQHANTRGFKFIVGALNWSSAFAKDPNVIFKGGAKHRQRVVVQYASEIPGGHLDTMLYEAWARAAAFDMPAKGRIAAYDHAAERGVTWQTAVDWLRTVFCGDGVDGLYLKDKGITTYAVGTRPRAGGDWSMFWWPQWAGGFHYRALMQDDAELASTCERLDQQYLSALDNAPQRRTVVSISNLPSLWWVWGAGDPDSALGQAVKRIVEKTHDKSMSENGKDRTMDYGTQSTDAEGLLLGADIWGNDDYRRQALVLIDEINAQLDGAFWWFGNTTRESMFHGGQIRPMGHGHAALANYMAWKATGNDAYLNAARRFTRYLLAINYVTHNASGDPDFDWRGWANGTIAGRDQYAEFPPWETCNPLICLAAMMEEVDFEEGFYDVLWYFERTGLAQFPAARHFKRILDEGMQQHFVPRSKIASERDFYDKLPYLAYENPLDQTLLASYQGTDCLTAELIFAGGLARTADDRLSVIVPRAAMMKSSETTNRLVHVWNPTSKLIDTTISVTWPDGSTAEQPVSVPKRKAIKLEFTR